MTEPTWRRLLLAALLVVPACHRATYDLPGPAGLPLDWSPERCAAAGRDACDRGHWFLETCDGPVSVVRFPVLTAQQNVGSRQAPLPAPGGCMLGAALPLVADDAAAGAVECPWDPRRGFRGWQGAQVGRAPAPYARALAAFAGF